MLDIVGFNEKGQGIIIDRSARYPTRITCDVAHLTPSSCAGEAGIAFTGEEGAELA
jgi:hypothetical protein